MDSSQAGQTAQDGQTQPGASVSVGQSDQNVQVNPVGQPPQVAPQPTPGNFGSGSNATSAAPVMPAPAGPKPFDLASGKPSDSSQGRAKEQEKTPAKVVAVGPSEVGQKFAEADKVAREEGDEYWQAYAREIELEKELAEAGGMGKLEAGEAAGVGKMAEEMGDRAGPPAQMAQQGPFSVRGVALSGDQITTGLTKPTSSGFRWLVEWFIYQLLKAHFLLKKVGGKIVRRQVGSSQGG